MEKAFLVSLAFVSALSLSLAVPTQTAPQTKENKGEATTAVVELNDKSFASFTTSRSVVLVEFYADWCSHCKAFEPVFESLAEHFKANVSVGRINAPEYMDLSRSQGIKALPTIKIYM